MPVFKKCSTCKEEKSLKHFYKQNKGLLGRTGSCKVCRRIRTLAYQKTEKAKQKRKEWDKENRKKYGEKNRERNRKFRQENPNYWKEYYQQNKGKRAEYNKRFWNDRPLLRKFYSEYHYALKSKTIVKSSQCQICGIFCKTEGHHFDYTKPLDVTWVCNECHKNIHRKKRKKSS